MSPLLNTISRIETTNRVHNWLKYATKKLGFKPADVPKAIFIPRADIDDAIHEFEKFDKLERKASGIRIYFTKKFPMNDKNDDLRITCVVVPTVQANKKDKTTGKLIHKDAIIRIPANRSSGAAMARVAAAVDGGDTETIYDITSPCPTDCNGTTPW